MRRVIVNLQLRPTSEGGRTQPIPVMDYSCPVFFRDVPGLGEQGYDCRLLVGEFGRPIRPGEKVERIPMLFLSEEEVLAYVEPGAQFSMWEGGEIGKGYVLEIESAPV